VDRADGGRREDVDLLEGGADRRGVRLPPVPRWLLGVLAAVVAGAGIVVAGGEDGGPSGPPGAVAPAVSPSARPSASWPAGAGPVVVTTVGRALLPTTDRWELFGRGAQEVVRIEVALGRVTRTVVPALRSGGPVSFLTGTGRALIRPLDLVTGYVVPDGQPAREMPPALGHGGPMFPGPDPGHVWVRSEDGARPAMVLRALDGGADRASIPLPGRTSPLEAIPDGSGHLLYAGTGGTYHARPDGLHRITTGSVLAVGPRSWLTVECDDRDRCRTVVIGRPSGSRRTIGATLDPTGPRGVISPDGTTAAMVGSGPGGGVGLRLLDLASGASRPVDVPIGSSVIDGTVVWSPDSRWLFALGADGTLRVVDPATARVAELGVALPPLRQLTVRAARAG
jgi:hypothetical protein